MREILLIYQLVKLGGSENKLPESNNNVQKNSEFPLAYNGSSFLGGRPTKAVSCGLITSRR